MQNMVFKFKCQDWSLLITQINVRFLKIVIMTTDQFQCNVFTMIFFKKITKPWESSI